MKTRAEQLKEIDRLLNSAEAKIANAFQQGIDNIQDEVVLAEITRRLEIGNISEVTTLVNQTLVGASFIEFNRSLQEAYISGGRFAERIAEANKIKFAFDITDAGPSVFMRDYKADKVRQITAEMQQTITQIVQRDTAAGVNPNTVARKLQDRLGLTAGQERAVENYESFLDNLENEALQRDLRDRRFDPTVRRAINTGQPLSAEKKKKMVAQYRNRYIKRRAKTIARTEAIRLNSAGQNEYWNTAIKEGEIDRERVLKKWIPTWDGKLRDAHAAIPRLNPDGVAQNQAFKSPLGPIKYPGDPTAVAGNVVNCRCAIFTRIKGA